MGIETALLIGGIAAAAGGLASTGYSIASGIDQQDKQRKAEADLKAKQQADQAALADANKQKQARFRLLQGGASTAGDTIKTSPLGAVGDDASTVRKMALGL